MSRLPENALKHTLEALYDFLKASPNMLNESVPLTTGAAPVSPDLTVYETKITSGGTAGSEDLNVGDGTGAIIGQRHLFTFETRTNGSDVINFDHANMDDGLTITDVSMDAADEFILLEWNGLKWQIIYSAAGVVTSS